MNAPHSSHSHSSHPSQGTPASGHRPSAAHSAPQDLPDLPGQDSAKTAQPAAHAAAAKQPRFTDYPLLESIMKDIKAAGWESPTPIQAQCLVPALAGRDIIGLAQTGTGKTGAFALPIIQKLAGRLELGALVLAPTRELAHQIVAMFRELGRSSGTRVVSIYGGVPMENDYKALQSWPNVLVATPGRLIDHIGLGTVSMKEIEIFAVDEADRMHDMGFMPQIRRILAVLPEKRQTLMFTATMPPDVEKIVRKSMNNPVRVQVGRQAPAERARQQLFDVHDEDKTPLLLELLKEGEGRVLIFVRTKRGVERLASAITHRHRAGRLHGDREQAQRDEAMAGFRQGKHRILIATDIAARGLDVADIEHVINYDFPRSADDYVHRIGRTARVAASGLATSFVTRADRRYLADVERLIGEPLPITRYGAAGQAAGAPTHAGATHAPAGEHGEHRRHTGGAPGQHGHGDGQKRRRRGRGGRGRGGHGPAAHQAPPPPPVG